jgi:hypothetical protein
VTRASNPSSVLSGSIRPLTAIVIVLVFALFSGVILAQYVSSPIISNGGITPEPFWDFKAKAGRDWFPDLTEAYQRNQQQDNGLVDGKIDVSSNSVNTIQVAVGVGVYWDANCSFPVSSLDWGSVFPGSVMNITVFIRNEGDAPSTVFLRVTNWSPANASNFLALNWDYNNSVVNSRQTIKVMLTFSVASAAEGITDFCFDVIIGVNG